MCGIAGYRGPSPPPPARVEACLRLMHRRGPDFATSRRWIGPGGTVTDLLFSRLSIIDIDPRANQPLGSGSHWMICNGELYNYRELRAELEAAGERFHTASDVDVFVRWLDRFGPAGLDRCEGMWAFALYDEAADRLTLCRDRFGEKPLYILRDGGGGLYFGSEVKFLAALAGRRLSINARHLRRYLVNGFKALYKTSDTFFEGVEEVPSAGLLTIGDGSESSASYWAPRYAPDEAMSFQEAVEAARARVIRSVELRLRSDVPIAFCMSGGVDSNSLISVARRVCGYDVHGFTIVNDDPRYDETELVDVVVRELGIRHTAIPVDTSGFLPRLRALVRQHDAPVYTISYYAHYLLMEGMARGGYRIAISGTGADELFTGYYDHHLAYLAEVHGSAAWQPALEAWTAHVKPIVRNPYLSNPDLFVGDPDFRGHIYLDAGGFAAMLRGAAFDEPFTERRYDGSVLRNRMLNELLVEIVPVILHEDDLNAMYFSIENRSPFLDRDLMEQCYRIPTRHLVQNGRAKAVLREAMRGIVPGPVLDCHRKVGFNAPIFSFLDVRDPVVREELLREGPIFDVVRRDAIVDLIDRLDLPNSQSKFLFYFVSAKMFLEEFA